MAKLYFYYSTMNAGKSTILLQSSYNYRERGMRTMLFAAALDDRYGVGKITSRIGLEEKALLFDAASDLLETVIKAHREAPVSCVLVDEAQFLTGDQVMQLSDVADGLGIPVIAYGLRTDFRGRLFPGSEALLALADEMREVKTICHCGRKATMVVRRAEDGAVLTEGAQVMIGGNDTYETVCRTHWKELVGHGLPRA